MKKMRATFALLLLIFGLCPTAWSQSVWPAGKTALMIIDIQEFYFPGGVSELREPERATANTALLLDYFRAQGWPVVHIGHRSSKQQDFYPQVSPGEGEYILMKEKVNAFASGELHAYLQQQGITHLIICGMQTHMCVEAATRAAADLGYDCTLVRDACATRDLKFQDAVIPAQMVHNSTLATLSGTYAKISEARPLLGELMKMQEGKN